MLNIHNTGISVERVARRYPVPKMGAINNIIVPGRPFLT
jgi:hypothetical protein